MLTFHLTKLFLDYGQEDLMVIDLYLLFLINKLKIPVRSLGHVLYIRHFLFKMFFYYNWNAHHVKVLFVWGAVSQEFSSIYGCGLYSERPEAAEGLTIC